MTGDDNDRTDGASREPGGAVGGPRHVPVLLAEVLVSLEPKPGETYIDATFGAGGYSRAILEAAECRVLALDRDPTAVRAAAPLCQRFANRLTVVEACFGKMEEVARVYLSSDARPDQPSVFTAPDGVVLDVGVSSMQLDQPERGFSFMTEGPLDMRMTASGAMAGPTAADVVNRFDETEIADILYQLGEERRSRAIARAILKSRAEAPIETTTKLAALVCSVLGPPRRDEKHPATRTFQALRIYVNDELGELANALSAAERILKPGGRLVVVSFHSLEDRIVKRFLTERSKPAPKLSRHMPAQAEPAAAQTSSFRLVNPRPLTPGEAEVWANPRARSARLRAAERISAPPWPLDLAALGGPRVRQDRR